MSYQGFSAFSRGEMKWKARKALSGHWLTAVLITILLLVFNNATSYAVLSMLFPGMTPLVFLTDPSSVMTEEAMQALGMMPPSQLAVVTLIGIVSGMLVSGVYQLAMTMFYLDLAQTNPNAGLSDFFGHFSEGLRGILMFLWQGLWIYLWSILFLLPGMAVMGAGFTLMGTESSVGGLVTSFGVALLVAGAVGTVYKTLQYSLCFFALADEPSMGPRKALRASIEATRGHIGALFMLYLSFIGWFILTMFPFVSLYVTPYFTSTIVQAWLHLRDRALEEGRLRPEMFGLEAVVNTDLQPYSSETVDAELYSGELPPHEERIEEMRDAADHDVESLERHVGKDDKR